MKCPRCGNEIKDGNLYCEHCAMEIRIVPEYDTEVEQEMQDAMQTVSDSVAHALDQQPERGERGWQEEEITLPLPDMQAVPEKTRQQKRHRRDIVLVLVGVLVGALLVVLFLLFHFSHEEKGESYYVGEAYRFAEDGAYEEAAEQIALAMEATGEDRVDLVLQRAEYLRSAGEYDKALEETEALLEKQDLTQDQKTEVYRKLLTIYASQDDYEAAAKLIGSCEDEDIRETFREYRIEAPALDAAAGSYEDELILTISADCQGSIFYTIDGSTPTTQSSLYQSPLHLKEGEYTVAAVCVNRFGVKSRVVRREYTVEPAKPDAPEVITPEGTYNSPTLIAVSAPKHGKIYYTTDGTDPTEESREYTGKIIMPLGSSVYKFVCINENGIASEIVEKHYTLNVSSNFSIEDGPNYILVAMINAGEVVDVNGTITGGSARYIYNYQGIRQIEGYGTFYIYAESLMDYVTGASVETGRRFAVNIKNGTVNLYGENGELSPVS